MNVFKLLVLAFCFVSFSSFAQTTWIGNFRKQSERGALSACQTGKPVQNNTVVIDSWDSSRALIINLCFEVYVQGLTDQKNIRPADLDVYAQVPGKVSAKFVGKTGNNYVYVLNVRELNSSYAELDFVIHANWGQSDVIRLIHQ